MDLYTHLVPCYRWIIIDPITGEITYTTEDQIISFTIIDAPINEYTITYKLNGGNYEGSSEDIIEVYFEDEIITIHNAPTRDGYTFLFWRGLVYYLGDKYKVKENHTFVAVWKRVGPDPIPPYDPPRTGIK